MLIELLSSLDSMPRQIIPDLRIFLNIDLQVRLALDLSFILR